MPAVLSPVAGIVMPLESVSDPVFATGLVGAGVAIEPSLTDVGAGRPSNGAAAAGDFAVVDALAPISGRLMKAFSHAFVISGESLDVLVHLGLDTLSMNGDGFELLAAEGADVHAGTPVIRWSPSAVAARGLSPVVLICLLGVPLGVLDAGSSRAVAPGDYLFDLPEL